MLRTQQAFLFRVPGRDQIDRLGGSGKKLNALASSIKAEVPLALSSAPGWILPYGPKLLPRLPMPT